MLKFFLLLSGLSLGLSSYSAECYFQVDMAKGIWLDSSTWIPSSNNVESAAECLTEAQDWLDKNEPQLSSRVTKLKFKFKSISGRNASGEIVIPKSASKHWSAQ
ncbi:MAG: hypothetical protein H6621_08195 [Halobacteriovoraceae bacterium]|nr:hypothetical protein [Halobacteriovoraceae bacterium]